MVDLVKTNDAILKANDAMVDIVKANDVMVDIVKNKGRNGWCWLVPRFRGLPSEAEIQTYKG